MQISFSFKIWIANRLTHSNCFHCYQIFFMLITFPHTCPKIICMISESEEAHSPGLTYGSGSFEPHPLSAWHSATRISISTAWSIYPEKYARFMLWSYTAVGWYYLLSQQFAIWKNKIIHLIHLCFAVFCWGLLPVAPFTNMVQL